MQQHAGHSTAPGGNPSAPGPFSSRSSLHDSSAAAHPIEEPIRTRSQETKGQSTSSLDDHGSASFGAGHAGGAGAGFSAVAMDKSESDSQEPERGNSTSANKVRKWVWIVAAVVVVVAVAVGIGAWRAVANKNRDSGSPANLQYINGTAKVVKSDPSDPSKFEKDPRLKRSFYGMTYTPYGAVEPACGATLANVTEDIQLLSQLTTRLRTYGSACNQTELILDAIARTKTNLTVFVGANVSDDVRQQQQRIFDAFDKFGVKHVGGVTIGDEYILNDADSTAATASDILYIGELITEFNTTLLAKNYGKTFPIGSCDGGPAVQQSFARELEYIMVKSHPWFRGVSVEQAAGWTWDDFQRGAVDLTKWVSNPVTPYIAETGWPTASIAPENATYEGAVAGVPELQTFLDTFVCQANKNETYYFYHEPFDQPSEEQYTGVEPYRGVEPYFGLFDQNRILKNITIPECAVDSTKASG
ncbi:hypothetical protein JCM10212_004547 [Sporobolomyces blumeae]